ncbi:MAG: hypothetical protein AAFP03_10640, partial [Cyanobacteria bacterium J06598_3]
MVSTVRSTPHQHSVHAPNSGSPGLAQRPLATPEAISHLQVDGERLMETVTEIGNIGGLENGGVRRLAFSPEDVQA